MRETINYHRKPDIGNKQLPQNTKTDKTDYYIFAMYSDFNDKRRDWHKIYLT